MKRSREQVPSNDSAIKQVTGGKVFYDCTYPGCKVRAHNQHNLDKHIISHIEKDNKKKDKNNDMKI
jgi:hypothetical protein